MKKFNYDYLLFWFQSKRRLFNLFSKYKLGRKKKERRLFFDNEGKILLVAHIDTVQEPKIHRITTENIHAQGLDDRLGCAIGHWIMQPLPVDLLICDYEESGASTAQYHDVKDTYNFIIELDRAGTDFVDYEGMAEPAFITDIKNIVGMNQGWGTFTDLCFLDTKKIGAVNWGIGYHNAHSRSSYAPVKEVMSQIEKLWTFIQVFQDRPYSEGVQTYKYYNYNKSYDYKNYQNKKNNNWYMDTCKWCGEYDDIADMDEGICYNCQTRYGLNTFSSHTNTLEDYDDYYEDDNNTDNKDDDEYETYNVIIDGKVTPTKFKKIKKGT